MEVADYQQRPAVALVGADELAGLLGTIHYEVVTSIAARVARVPVQGRS